MERLAPAGDVYQAGTLSGNPLAVAAGLAALAMLDAGAYERLTHTTDELAARPARGGRRPARAGGASPAWSPSSSAREPVRDYAGARACDLDAHAAWCRELLARGVYPPPSQFEAWFPSLAHGPAARRAHDRGGDGRLRRAGVSARERLHSELRDHEDSLLPRVALAGARSTATASGPAQAARRRPARRRAARRVRAARGADPGGLPPALPRRRRGGAARRPSTSTLLLGDQLYAMGLDAPGRAGRPRRGDRAGRRDLPQRAGPRRGRRAARAGGLGDARAGPWATGARRPEHAATKALATTPRRRADAGAPCAVRSHVDGTLAAAFNSAALPQQPVPDRRAPAQVPLHRRSATCPGRSRARRSPGGGFMTGSAQVLGGVAVAAFALPALGFALGPVFEREDIASGATSARSRTSLTPRTCPGGHHAGAGSARRARRPSTCAATTSRSTAPQKDQFDELRGRQHPLRAPGLPGPLRRGLPALHLPLPRRRVRLRGQGLGRPAGAPAGSLLHARGRRPGADRAALQRQLRAASALPPAIPVSRWTGSAIRLSAPILDRSGSAGGQEVGRPKEPQP